MWIYLALAAGFGLWYYETHKPAAAKPSMGAGPVLDANMPPAAQDALIKMVMAQTDPAVLDGAAVTLANAPPPGPYPLAAAWVKSQAAALRAKQGSFGKDALGSPPLPTPVGHTPVMIPSRNGARPAVNMNHPTLTVLNFHAAHAPGQSASMHAPAQPVAAPPPALHFNLRGKALMNLAWNALMKTGYAFASWVVPPTAAIGLDPNTPAYFDPSVNALDPALLGWRNLYILGNLEEPIVMADPDAKTFWQNLTVGNPYFAKGAPGSKALGWS